MFLPHVRIANESMHCAQFMQRPRIRTGTQLFRCVLNSNQRESLTVPTFDDVRGRVCSIFYPFQRKDARRPSVSLLFGMRSQR